MSTSPSSRLDLDSLSVVFEIITRQMPEPQSVIDYLIHPSKNSSSSPLNDVRAASQVCALWRRSLLASPWIWGRVVDLDVLCFGTVNAVGWLEEVVRRAGSSSPLWISGNVIGSYWPGISDTKSFFIRLISTRWERIEKLVVVIHEKGVDDSDAIQTRFLTRAPILKVFDVCLLVLGVMHRLSEHSFKSGDQIQHGDGGSSQRGDLFANDAPALRTVNWHCISFDPESSWFPRITHMSFTPSHRLSMNDLLGVLQRAHNLTKIKLDTTFSKLALSRERLPTQVHLPNLSSLCLITTLAHCAEILEHVSLRKLSMLCIRIDDPHPPLLSQNILMSFEQNLPVLISNYFNKNVVVGLRLMVWARRIVFHSIHHNEDMEDQGFELRISQYGRSVDQADADRVVACLLDAITLASRAPQPEPGCFDTITDITLDFENLRPIVHRNVRLALATLRRVQCVRVHEDSLSLWSLYHVMCPYPQAGGEESHDIILFPELHTIHMFSPQHIYDKTVDSRETGKDTYLTKLLLHRSKTGFPISRVDLTRCARLYYNAYQDFSPLEEIGGLEVVWKERNRNLTLSSQEVGDCGGISSCMYVCGSGDPRRGKNVPIGYCAMEKKEGTQ